MVITIIAVLAGLLLPVVSKVTENARKVEAKSAETQIISAVKSFQTYYGVYPAPAGMVNNATPTDLAFAPPNTSNAPLFYILRATESANGVGTPANTRSVVYFEGNDAKNTSSPRSGFVQSTATTAKGNPKAGSPGLSPGDFVDPWGNRYGILTDTNYNNVVTNPYTGTYTNDDPTISDSTKDLRFGVVVWLPGNDGVFSTTASPIDDVISWQ